MASRAESGAVNVAGLVQGVALVTFPAASMILTNPADYGLSSSRYGAMFQPQVVLAIAAPLAGAPGDPLRSEAAGADRSRVRSGVDGAAPRELAFMHNQSLAYAILLLATACLGAGFGLVVPRLDALGIVMVVAIVVYIVSFAFSLGPVVWTMINEFFPNRVRGKAVAFCTAINSGAAFLVSASFLSLVNAIGEAITFLLFAATCAVTFVWIRRQVPETKGKSLEEIERAWTEHEAAQAAPRTLPVG